MIKKVVVVAVAAAGGWLVYKRLQSDRAEQNLWAEATDSVNSSSR